MSRMDWDGARRRAAGRDGQRLDDLEVLKSDEPRLPPLPPVTNRGAALRYLTIVQGQVQQRRWRSARRYLAEIRRAYPADADAINGP